MSGTVVQAEIMTCNACGKPIAIKGVITGKVTAGELEVSFFRCPHCGRRYNTGTTDPMQRELMAEYKNLIERLKVATAKKFRQKEIEKMARRSRRLMENMRARLPELSAAGDRILSGEDGR